MEDDGDIEASSNKELDSSTKTDYEASSDVPPDGVLESTTPYQPTVDELEVTKLLGDKSHASVERLPSCIIPSYIGPVGLRDDGLEELMGIIHKTHGDTSLEFSAKLAIAKYDNRNLLPAAGDSHKWGSDAGILNAFASLS